MPITPISVSTSIRRGGDFREAADHLPHRRADVADLILEKWNSMERTHQDALRLQLQGLLWRIRGREVSEPGSYRTVGIDLDVDTMLRGIKLASSVWGELDSEQRQRIRMALQSFRASAARLGRQGGGE